MTREHIFLLGWGNHVEPENQVKPAVLLESEQAFGKDLAGGSPIIKKCNGLISKTISFVVCGYCVMVRQNQKKVCLKMRQSVHNN
jgi:hypothetical protein